MEPVQPSDLAPEVLAQEALQLLEQGDFHEARRLLRLALDGAPGRPDLLHALAFVEKRAGEPAAARALALEALNRLTAFSGADADTLRASVVLTLASIFKDLDEPGEALAAYDRVLTLHPSHPDARSGMGFLFLALGRMREGLDQLERLGRESLATDEATEACRQYVEAATRWQAQPSPDARRFLQAHQGVYSGFFTHCEKQVAARGWLAEKELTRRGSNGELVSVVPEGARAYARVRLDLVDPSTGQGGLVGEEPVPAALAGYEALARSPCLLPWPSPLPFEVWISTVCPWNDLPIQVETVGADPLLAVDPVVGAWYQAGFDGAFGAGGKGFFHRISEPEVRHGHGLAYNVDMGRAGVGAIEDLVARLVALHGTSPLKAVVLGQGFLPL